MKLGKRKIMQETVELNITAFLNLMVILVPFLLITAVFSRLTVLELNLPARDAVAKQQQDEDKLQLQLVLLDRAFIIRDATVGTIGAIKRSAEHTNWKALSDVLLEIKNRYPEENSITLLLAPGISYKTLIEVMDRVRSVDVLQVTDVVTVELFPNISIGDAPDTATTQEQSPEGDRAP